MKTMSPFMAGTPMDSCTGKKLRKPYTITKSRERWSDEEHAKFLEALHLFGRDWKKIEDYVGSKTVIQIRSHAQKYFLKIQKSGAIMHVPPPRRQRKAVHPYSQKAFRNESVVHPSTYSCASPRLSHWDDSVILMNAVSKGSMPSQGGYTYVHAFEDSADLASEGAVSIGNCSFSGSGSSCIRLPSSTLPKQSSTPHGTSDFAKVYNFIGNVFDPDTNGHLQKLKEVDPINLNTLVMLMKNLTANLTSPGFEPIEKGLPWCHHVNGKTGAATGVVAAKHRSYYLPSVMAGN